MTCWLALAHKSVSAMQALAGSRVGVARSLPVVSEWLHCSCPQQILQPRGPAGDGVSVRLQALKKLGAIEGFETCLLILFIVRMNRQRHACGLQW
jgi:hypothetical protein